MSESLDPRSFHPGAVAVLELVAGGVDDGAIKGILENYEYLPDKRDRSFWLYKDDESNGLMFARENNLAIIVGNDEDHVENVNYVLSGIGWSTAILHSVSVEAEEQVVGSMNTLLIENIVRCWDESSQDTPAGAADPSEDNGIDFSSPNVGTQASSFPVIEEVPAIPASAAREPVASVAAPSTALPAAFQSLRTAPAGSEAFLLKVIEEHVLTSLVPPLTHPVLQALKSAGYEVKFTLQRIG